jgi:hypothetical protein
MEEERLRQLGAQMRAARKPTAILKQKRAAPLLPAFIPHVAAFALFLEFVPTLLSLPAALTVLAHRFLQFLFGFTNFVAAMVVIAIGMRRHCYASYH